MITNIFADKNRKQLIQRFLLTSGDAGIGRNIILDKVIRDHNASTVGITDDKRIILKLVKARTWHEHYKILWKRSRTHTEFTGAKLLTSIGIDTPKVYEMGISFPIAKNAKYIGYYLMENLDNSGYFLLSDIQASLTDKKISQLTREIERIMEVLYENRVVYSDLNLGNIFVNPETMDIKLIDTGAKRYFRRKSHIRKHNKAIRSFIKTIKQSSFKGSDLDMYCQKLSSQIK